MLKWVYKKIKEMFEARWFFDLLILAVVYVITRFILSEENYNIYWGKPFWAPFAITLSFEIVVGGIYASGKVSKCCPILLLMGSIAALFFVWVQWGETDSSNLKYGAVYALVGGYLGSRLATYLMPCILKCCIFQQQNGATVGGNGTGTQPGDKAD